MRLWRSCGLPWCGRASRRPGRRQLPQQPRSDETPRRRVLRLRCPFPRRLPWRGPTTLRRCDRRLRRAPRTPIPPHKLLVHPPENGDLLLRRWRVSACSSCCGSRGATSQAARLWTSRCCRRVPIRPRCFQNRPQPYPVQRRQEEICSVVMRHVDQTDPSDVSVSMRREGVLDVFEMQVTPPMLPPPTTCCVLLTSYPVLPR